MSLKRLKKPPPTTVSHHVKLQKKSARDEGREKDEARRIVTTSSTPSNTRFWLFFLIKHSELLSPALKLELELWILELSGSFPDVPAPEAKATHELGDEALVLWRCYILFHAARANTRHIFNIHLGETSLTNTTTAA